MKDVVVCPIIVILFQDDDHDAEEWERYETFHDDVDKQVATLRQVDREIMKNRCNQVNNMGVAI